MRLFSAASLETIKHWKIMKKQKQTTLVYVKIKEWREIHRAMSLSIKYKRLLKYLDKPQHDNIVFIVPIERIEIFKKMVNDIFSRNSFTVEDILTSREFYDRIYHHQ